MNLTSTEDVSQLQIHPLNSFKTINPWSYALGSCFLLLGLLSARRLYDSDLGYHLRTGQWIVENLKFPSKEVFCYSVLNHAYLDIHWLYQVSLYLLYGLGGFRLISLLEIILLFAIFFITWKRMEISESPPWVCVPFLAATLLACELRFQARPEILSWLFLSLDLLILELRAKRIKDLLIFLPFIQCLWANVEGLFPLGLGLIAVFSISSFFDIRGGDRKLLGIFALSLLAGLVNPYLINGMLFPIQLLKTLGSSSVFDQSISEFQPPWTLARRFLFVPSLYLMAYELFSLCLLVLFLATFRQRKIQDWALAVSLFGLSATAMRNIPLFMLACSPLAAASWKDLKGEVVQKLEKLFLSKAWIAWVFALFLLGLGLRTVTNAYYISDRRIDRFGWGLDEKEVPLRACQFMRDNHLTGKILNEMFAGGWLDWKGPQLTFIDGRLELMGPELYSEYIDSLNEGGVTRLINRIQPDIIVFKTTLANQWILDLRKWADWRPVFLDESTAIYLRRGYNDPIPSLDYERLLSERDISKTISLEARKIVEASPPSPLECFIDDFCRPTIYPVGLSAMGVFADQSGHPEFGEPLLLEAIRESRGRYYDFFFNLGQLYFYNQQVLGARYCMARVLKDSPSNAQAIKIMSFLPQ